jgi:hypothetical protein
MTILTSGDNDRVFKTLFLSTDMKTVYLNIEVTDYANGERKIFSMPISKNDEYIQWLIDNYRDLSKLYHQDGGIWWFDRHFQGKYRKEIMEYYAEMCTLYNIPREEH